MRQRLKTALDRQEKASTTTQTFMAGNYAETADSGFESVARNC
jgi:hypothetical protein